MLQILKMHFYNPAMFWWLFALLIPVIVHLFNFRKHKLLLFSNVAFLKQLQEETSKKRNIKHYLILLSRLLFIAAIVLAFAQPYRPSENQINPEASNLVRMYVDNSMSMQLRARSFSLLDETRQHAIQSARQFGLNNRFFLSTNDFLPQHQTTLDLDELIRELEQIPAGASPVSISDVFIRANTLQHHELSDNKIQFVFSDFQKSTFNLEQIRPDTSLHLYLVPVLPAKLSNIYIDSCWFESPVLHPGIPLLLKLRLGNAGTEDAVSIPVSLEIEGQQTLVTNIDIPANELVETSMQFVVSKTGFHRAKLSILDFPVVFDDELYFTFELRPQISILEIHEGNANKWLRLLYEEDAHMQLTSVNRLQLDLQSLTAFDLVVLSSVENIPTGFANALEQYVDEGGSLVLIPPKPDALPYQSLALNFGMEYLAQADTARTRVFAVESQHPLLKDVFVTIPDNPDFPNVFAHYTLRLLPQNTARTVISLLNGNPMLVAANYGNGSVYGLASPLDSDWTDFVSNSLFVPVFYRMALMAARHNVHYYVAGSELKNLLRTTEELNPASLRIKSFDGAIELIPGLRISNGRQEIYLPEMKIPAGHYGLFHEEKLILLFALNDDRSESDLQYHEPAAVAASLSDAFKSVTVLDMTDANASQDWMTPGSTQKWYQYFVLLALLFLLIEILIVRFWK